MFLFWEEWKPENIFGEGYLEEERTRLKKLQEGSDLFDDDEVF